MKIARTILFLGIVLVVGCVTDKVIVFEKGILSDEEMKPFLGSFVLTEYNDPGNGEKIPFKEGDLAIEKKDAQYRFSLKVVDNDDPNGERYAGDILLSKIPGSKSGLLLGSSPQVTYNEDDQNPVKNFFCIAKEEKGVIHVWFVLDDNPVAKEHVSVAHDAYPSADMKAFLEQYADAFVEANKPVYTFKKK